MKQIRLIPIFRVCPLFISAVCVWLTGCGSSDSGNSSSSTESQTEEREVSGEFDLREAGLRGMKWSGDAVVLDPDLSFELERMEMSTIVFTLITHPREMTDLKNPPLQFNGKPVEMSLRVSGVVENHSPGRVDVAIQSIRPGFGGGTGTRDEEKLIGDLAANGVRIPEASTESPIPVRFEVTTTGEKNRRLTLVANVEWLGRIHARDGEKADF